MVFELAGVRLLGNGSRALVSLSYSVTYLRVCASYSCAYFNAFIWCINYINIIFSFTNISIYISCMYYVSIYKLNN